MKILIFTPSFAPHGGIRVICEWANRLSQLHTVFLYSLAKDKCSWYKFSNKVNFVTTALIKVDCVIITSPHSIQFQHAFPGAKVFVFVQMMEHMFNNSKHWKYLCDQFYHTPHDIISISRWNMRELRYKGSTGRKMFYVGNGVNTKDFPVKHVKKDNKTVLVEGLNPINASKDEKMIGAKVAMKLKREGYRIIGYGLNQTTNSSFLDEYIVKPDQKQLNRLYEAATIMIKASKYDARSCAPMEAFTKGTVTARAIIEGDDDLIHDVNCLRCLYSEQQLYRNAKNLLENPIYRQQLADHGYEYIKEFSWEFWMTRINEIISQSK